MCVEGNETEAVWQTLLAILRSIHSPFFCNNRSPIL